MWIRIVDALHLQCEIIAQTPALLMTVFYVCREGHAVFHFEVHDYVPLWELSADMIRCIRDLDLPSMLYVVAMRKRCSFRFKLSSGPTSQCWTTPERQAVLDVPWCLREEVGGELDVIQP